MSATGEHTSQKSVDLFVRMPYNTHMKQTKYDANGPEYNKDTTFSWNLLISIAYGLGEGIMAGLVGLFD